MSSKQNGATDQVSLADVGFRLRQERERLRFSVAAFAERIGVSDRSQRNYESGLRLPDAGYLVEAYKLGADTDFILNGIDSSRRSLGQVSASIAAERETLEKVLRVFDIAYQNAQIHVTPERMNACIVHMYVTGRHGGPVTIEVANELIALAAR